MKKTTAALIALLALAAGSASAINVSGTSAAIPGPWALACPLGQEDSRLQNYLCFASTNIISTTSAANLGIVTINPAKSVAVSLKSSLAASVTTITVDNAGNTLTSTSTAVAAGIPAMVTLTTPSFFAGIKVSVTTILSATNALSATVIER